MDPVKRAEAELDELLKEVQKPALDAAGNPVVTAPTDATGTPAAAPAAAVVQPAQNPAGAPADGQQSQPEDAAYWKNRCDVVLGKYNAEVPRLSAEITRLKRQLADLQAAQVTAPAAAAQVEGDDYRSPHVSAEMRTSRSYLKMAKEFGTDYAETHFEGAALSARQAAKAEIQPLQETAALSATERLHADISSLSPGWMATNDDPKFIEWAKNTTEPYSGQTVITLLNNAYNSGDAARVAKIFNDYNQMLTSTSTSTATSGRPSADALVAPAKRGSSAQTNADTHQGKVWTEKEVDRFYDDFARGRYENRQKEAKEIEAEIGRAYAEGRVQ
jgi:hypothetical protein